MVLNELIRVVEQVGKDKGINRETVLDVVKTAMITAAKKKFGSQNEIDAVINEETREVELYLFKRVVENVSDKYSEISLDEALKLDPNTQIGDELGVKLDSAQFGRIAAQIVKQVIIQRIRDAEKEIIYNEFKNRQGEIISGVCRRIERGNVIVDLGKTEAVLPITEQIPGESFRVGDRVQGFLLQVQQSQRGPRIILSRSSELFLMKLFELEIPEIREGIIEIKGCARAPGIRSKISVHSKDRDVDPVGACVGMKGARVQNVIHELRGEKIDIVPFHEDMSQYVCAAISPAEVVKVVVEETKHRMEIVVPDDHLSLAIGKKGLNVRLAGQLTGWELDVVSESQISQKVSKARKDLLQVMGMSDTVALALYQYGIDDVESLVKHDAQTLSQIPGLSQEKAEELLRNAAELIKLRKEEGRIEGESPRMDAGIALDKKGAAGAKAKRNVLREEDRVARNMQFYQLVEKIKADLASLSKENIGCEN